jgi:hypothetical protein
MAEVPDVRRALTELPDGTRGTILELRSGEKLRGEFLGFDGQLARIRTRNGTEEIEPEEVIGVFTEHVSPGPE